MTHRIERRWYVVQTHPHGEAKAAQHLARQGFETYCPRYLRRRSHARKVDFVAAPLFPRYLFVSISVLSQRWHAIRSTCGVACLVSNNDGPVPVADEVIEGLKLRADDHGFFRPGSECAYAPGQKVRVLDGAFFDHLGQFESMSDGERVAVLLDMLGRKVRVRMDAGNIEAA